MFVSVWLFVCVVVVVVFFGGGIAVCHIGIVTV